LPFSNVAGVSSRARRFGDGCVGTANSVELASRLRDDDHRPNSSRRCWRNRSSGPAPVSGFTARPRPDRARHRRASALDDETRDQGPVRFPQRTAANPLLFLKHGFGEQPFPTQRIQTDRGASCHVTYPQFGPSSGLLPRLSGSQTALASVAFPGDAASQISDHRGGH
jgi:hypothetical protein